MTDFFFFVNFQCAYSYRRKKKKGISVLFSRIFWQAGVIFEKILEGFCFGKAGIKWLQ